MNSNFWKHKRVLITGHEGFLGSNLTKALVSIGATVVGLDIEVFRKNTLLTSTDYKKIKTVKGSVTDFVLVSRILKKYKIDIVFHLAAEAIVGDSYKNPLTTFATNIEGTWNICEAARRVGGIEAIVIASSDKAYGSHKKLPYTETAPLVGRNPYDMSKSCADLIAHSYAHSYDLPVAITRCGNIYGPGDFNRSRIVPDAIRCALRKKVLRIRSDGKFLRDYVYVEDIVNGYILLVEKMEKLGLGGEAFNFSDEHPMTVLEIVRRISEVLGRKVRYQILNQAHYEIKRQYLSSQKARRVLGWKPVYSLNVGLRNTSNWYQNFEAAKEKTRHTA